MSATLSLWWQWRTRGTFPRAGGWQDQPLALLVKLEALEFVFLTWQLFTSEGGLSKLNPLQADLMDVLENGP